MTKRIDKDKALMGVILSGLFYWEGKCQEDQKGHVGIQAVQTFVMMFIVMNIKR